MDIPDAKWLKALGLENAKPKKMLAEEVVEKEVIKENRPEHLIASHCKPWRDWELNGRVAVRQNVHIRSTFRINGLRR